MTEKGLAERIAEESGLPLELVQKFVTLLFDIITETIIIDDVIGVSDFGKFKLVHLPERRGRNPKTGEIVLMPPHSSVRFSASGQMRRLVAATAPRELKKRWKRGGVRTSLGFQRKSPD